MWIPKVRNYLTLWEILQLLFRIGAAEWVACQARMFCSYKWESYALSIQKHRNIGFMCSILCVISFVTTFMTSTQETRFLFGAFAMLAAITVMYSLIRNLVTIATLMANYDSWQQRRGPLFPMKTHKQTQ